MNTSVDLNDYIRDVQDFPKPGISFKDITPLLQSHEALTSCIEQFAEHYKDQKIDVIAAAEARGFLFATPLAMKLGVGVVPIRKPGKLPYEKHSYSYDLEYGSDTLEMHKDALQEGQNVLVVDDLLATGGTVEACCNMIEKCGGHIAGCAFLINLTFLNGAKRLDGYPIFSLLEY